MTLRPPSDSETDRMLEREIEGLLRVDPPADFLPRLHERIHHAPLPSLWPFRKMYLTVTAAVAFAAVLALAIFEPYKTKWDAPGTPVRISTYAGASETPSVWDVPKPSVRRRVKLPEDRTSKPEMLISAEETRAIRRLLEEQVGPLPANLADSLAMPGVPGELVVPQIAIKPIEVPRPITVEPMSMPPAITDEGV